MTGAVFRTLLSHWWRNPLQLVTLVAGLALATALWSGVQAINAEARNSYDTAAALLGDGQFAQLVPASGTSVSEQAFVDLRRGGWMVSPVVDGRLNGVRILGIDPLTAPEGFGALGSVGGAALGDFLAGADTVFAHPDTESPLQDIAARTATPITVAGTVDLAPGTAVADIGLAQRLLGLEGRISRLVLLPEQPLLQQELAGIGADVLLRDPAQAADLDRLSDSFHLNLTAFGALAFAVGILIVHSAVGLAYEQRRPVVRSLRAMGAPVRALVLMTLAELAAITLVAGALGLGLGYVIAGALLPDVAATLRGIYGEDIAGSLTFRPLWALSGMAIAGIGTALAAAGAIWSLIRMPVLAGAHPRAVSVGSARMARLRAAASLALLVLAGVLMQVGSGLVAGFGLLACLLVGAALALPLVLDLTLLAAQRLARGPLVQWFLADTRQQLPALSLALAALLLAIAANVGVSTMVSSFRLTFVQFLDQRLASELYVYTQDEASAADLLAFVEPRVDAVLPLLATDQQLAGLPGEVQAARDHATYRDNWDFLTADRHVWDRLAAAEGVIINEQLSRRSGLGIGDGLAVGGTELEVIGVYGDYGNAIGQAILTEALFLRLYPDITPTRFGLRLPEAQVPEMTRALVEDHGLPEANIVDQAELKAFSLAVFDRTFTVTRALNILTLAVAGFAILMSLLTLAGMRLPQLAPIWALGLTRRELGRVELVRAVLLALLTSIVALPLGLGLAWVLLTVVNVEAFGWRLPMYLFPGDYLRLGALALLAAAVAALWPAMRLARTPPSTLLKVFANER